MRPLTDARPKPAGEVGGRPLIDYALERLREAAASGWWSTSSLSRPGRSWAARQSSPEIVVSDERSQLLDTGGGIVKALPLLGREPFFVLNSDSFWLDGREPRFSVSGKPWVDAGMDCLLLFCAVDRTIGYRERATSFWRATAGLSGADWRRRARSYISAVTLFIRGSLPRAQGWILDEPVVGPGDRLRRLMAFVMTASGSMSHAGGDRPCRSSAWRLREVSKRVRIFTIPPDVGFLPALVNAILAGGFPNPATPTAWTADLAAWTILLPTRRAPARSSVRSLPVPSRARLLPRIRRSAISMRMPSIAKQALRFRG